MLDLARALLVLGFCLRALALKVGDSNVDVTASLTGGVEINGKIIVADGASKPPFKSIRVLLWTNGNPRSWEGTIPGMPDAEGRFRFLNRPVAPALVSVGGLPLNFNVREIRYNGAAVTDNVFSPNSGSLDQSLEIVIDDKPSWITGTVTQSDQRVAGALAVLVTWPPFPQNVFLSVQKATADEKGAFHFTGLGPGEYRLLAVAPESAQKLDEPRVLERLLGSAERVTLTPASSQNVSLKAVDPYR